MTKIQLKRSSVLVNGTTSKAPTSSQLDYGELAIGYNATDPQFFIKDSSGNVIPVLDAYAKLDGSDFTGDVNFDGAVKIKGDSTNGAGKLTLSDASDTYNVNIKAPATSAAAAYTLTLPTSAGTNAQILTTDGSGNLYWAVSSMSVADKAKLDGIEAGATADQTGLEIKTAYEAEADTNAFTDALLNKLNNIAAGAQVNAVTSVNGDVGAVTVDYNDLTSLPTLGTAAATASTDYATAAQGLLADSAIQSADLSTVATTGSYNDLLNLPTLGTAAATASTDYATAAQGALAASAIQPADLSTVATTGSYNDLLNLPTIPTNNNQLTNGAGYITSADGGNAATLNGQQPSYYLDYNNLTNVPTGGNADTLDGLDSTSFLRSDASGTIDAGQSTTLTILCNDNGQAGIKLRGDSQGTGFVEVGQSTSYGGGFSYNGDGSPGFVSGETSDHITFYRLDNGTRTEVFHYPYNSNVVNFNSTPTSGGNTIWHAGNDGSGSGLDADNLDGYTWTSSGKDLRGTEIYADNWFRNYNSGEGIYNQANAMYWYSDTNRRWKLRSNQSTAQIIFATSSDSTRGYVYANDSNQIGFLDSDGNWAVRVVRDSYVELRDNDEVTFRAGQGGVDGNYGTVSTHGGGKGNWEGYSINGRYVWMHDGSTAAGLYNDVDNEWHVYMIRNSYVRLYHNGSTCFQTASSTSATIGGNTVWHSGNDGSGSGLDADTLDGVSSGSFVRSDTSDSVTGTIYRGATSPGSGNTSTGWSLTSSNTFYVSNSSTPVLFNVNANTVLVSLRRSGTQRGRISVTTSRAYFYTTSDYRLKENIVPISDGINRVKLLKPSYFRWIDSGMEDEGFIAHELAEVCEGAVDGEKDEVDMFGEIKEQGVEYSYLTPLLTAAIKEVIDRLEALESAVYSQ